MRFDNQPNGHEFQNNDSSTDIGPKLALWGSVLSALGDTLAVIGGAIAIEESAIADKMQQQQMDKLQSQIDELQKAQAQNNIMSIDIEKFNQLLEQMVERLEGSEEQKNKRTN